MLSVQPTFRVKVHLSSDSVIMITVLAVHLCSIKHNNLDEGDETIQMITALLHLSAESSGLVMYNDSGRTAAHVSLGRDEDTVEI